MVSHNGEHVLRKEIGRYFDLKEESIGLPKIYLEGHMHQVVLDNGIETWAFGSSQYVQLAVNNLEQHLKRNGLILPARALILIKHGYQPEVDVTDELIMEEAMYYQLLIGILPWIVELGCVDICCKVSLLSSHLALPHRGYLEQLYYMFGYLKRHLNAEMVFDPNLPIIDKEDFGQQDWTTLEAGLTFQEELPPNMPQPRGQGFVMRAFVDANQATNSVTQQSRTGSLVYLYCTPVYWMSKKQTSVKTSLFGSEFTAMKQCTKYVHGLWYKQRMMEISCTEPTFVYGDNKSILFNTTIPDSMLKKNSQSITYHFVREGAAKDEWRTANVNTYENPVDLLTKPLPLGEKQNAFIWMVLHHI